MALDSTDFELERVFLNDDSNGDPNLNVGSSSSTVCFEGDHRASSECIDEVEVDCISFSLLEVIKSGKVMDIFDLIHNEQTSLLFDSSEPESTKEMDRIILCKSLIQYNTLITNAENITTDDDCTSSNLQEIANHKKVLETTNVSHNEQTPQLVVNSESKSSIEIGENRLQESLALNKSFITAAECNTEAEVDCISSSLLEAIKSAKVMEIFDYILNEQTSQMVDSSEPENTKEMDNINLCKSLAQDNTLITSADCILEADDNCTSSNLLEIANHEKVLETTNVIHNEQAPILVENSEPRSTKGTEKNKLHERLTLDNAFITSPKCITEVEDECISSSLLEVIKSVKVVEIFDVIHNEQSSQLLDSLEPESTKEMDKINLCKSLAQDNALITSAGCIVKADDGCTSSNFLEVSNIETVLEIMDFSHNEETPQLVVNSEPGNSKEIELHKSLASDNTFITSSGCIVKADDGCTSSNFLEVANIETVLEIMDFRHNEETPQLVVNSEPGNSKEIELHKSLASDNAFITSSDCTTEYEDDSTSFNLLEVGNAEIVMETTDASYNEPRPQLVESAEPESLRDISKINLCKSLASDNTFFKSADDITEYIPEVKEDCTSSNILKVSHVEGMEVTDVNQRNGILQLFESSELESSRKNSKIDMRKSLAWDSAFLTNTECILETKDDCRSPIPLEDPDIEKVPEITDVSQSEQKPQLAKSLKHESRRKVSKIDLRKSLAWDSAFLTNAEGILDVEDDFSNSSLLEGSDLEKVPEMIDVRHKEPMPQLVESSEPESMKKTNKINLRKSLAWNNAFFTSAGLLDAQELSIMIDGADKGKTPALPGIEEDVRGSMDTISTLDSDCLTLESLEADLFLDVRASIQKSSKVSNMRSSSLKTVSEEKMVKGTCASKKTCLPPKIMTRTRPTLKKEAISGTEKTAKQVTAATARNGSLNSSNTTSSIAVSKRVSIDANRVKSANGIGKIALSSNYEGPPTKATTKSTLLSSKSTVLAPPHAKKGHPGSSSGLDTTGKVPLRKKLEPKRLTPASSSTLHKPPSMSVAAAALKKAQSNRDISAHLSSSKLSSSISPASSISEWSTESSSSISIITSELQENHTQVPLANESISVKPSGLRMPSPNIGFFDGAKMVARTAVTTSHQPSIPPVGLRRISGRTVGANVGSMSKASSSSQKASVASTQTGKINMLNKNASKSTTLLKEGKLSIDSHRISREANHCGENQMEDSNRKQTNLNLKSLERPPFSLKNASTFTDSENSPFFRGS